MLSHSLLCYIKPILEPELPTRFNTFKKKTRSFFRVSQPLAVLGMCVVQARVSCDIDVKSCVRDKQEA